jgi:hypothetical protein
MSDATFESQHPRNGTGPNPSQFREKPPLPRGDQVRFDEAHAIDAEESRQLCVGVSEDAGLAIGATLLEDRGQGRGITWEFGHGCKISMWVNDASDGYEIYGSRYNRQGHRLNFAQSVRNVRLDDKSAVQAAVYKMALELPRRREVS